MRNREPKLTREVIAHWTQECTCVECGYPMSDVGDVIYVADTDDTYCSRKCAAAKHQPPRAKLARAATVALVALVAMLASLQPAAAAPEINTVYVVAYSALPDAPYAIEYGAYIALRSEASNWEPARPPALGHMTLTYTQYQSGIVDVYWPARTFPIRIDTITDMTRATLHVVYYARKAATDNIQ